MRPRLAIEIHPEVKPMTMSTLDRSPANAAWPPKADLFGVGISTTNYEEAAAAILAVAQRQQPAVVCCCAVHGLVTAARDASLREKVNQFAMVTPDGQPVRWALNLLHGARLEDRVYGPELMLRLCRGAEARGVGVYLYGSKAPTVERLCANLRDMFPKLRIAGWEPSLFRPLLPEESRAVAARIRASGAGLVFIGLGCPRQELFAFDHQPLIDAVQVCVGAAFDFHAGLKTMAPRWMQRNGLEWLFRSVQEPRRLGHRYLVTNTVFLAMLFNALLRRVKVAMVQDISTHGRTAVTKSFARFAAGRAGAGLNLVLGSHSGDGFGILVYHRIAPSTPGVPAPTYNVAPDRFRRQLSGLLNRGYEPWPLSKVLAFHHNGQSPPPRTFVVTFDDVYGNVYQNAWPILRELRIPATIFLATAYLDRDDPFPFDSWALEHRDRLPVESYRPIQTFECREMLSSGLIEVGAHTHTHGDFRERPEELRGDVLVCKEVLRDLFGIEEPALAFPFGYGCRRWHGDALGEVVRQSGVKCALTTFAQRVRPGSDPFDWGRFGVAPSDTVAVLQAKLDGWYSIVWSACRRLWPATARSRGAHGYHRPSGESSCQGAPNIQGVREL